MKFLLLAPLLLAKLGSAAAILPQERSVGLAAPVEADHSLVALSQDDGLAQDDDDLGTDMVFTPSLVTRDDETSPDMHVDLGVGTIIGTVVNRVIYYTVGKVTKAIVKKVLDLLLKHNVEGQKKKITMAAVHLALEKVTTIILKKALIKDHASGTMQYVSLGADDGKGKVKRQEIEGSAPMSLISWDLSDDEAHSEGNQFAGRAIVSDELRTHMVGNGLTNITFAHVDADDSATPFLAYQKEDDSVHYHWRPSTAPALTSRGKDDKHYPFFDAAGAGFKISAGILNDPKNTPFSDKDAAAAAKLMVNDFLTKRTADSIVGYQEQSKSSKLIGHRLCFIAEDKRFELNNEFTQCFAAAK